MLTAEEKKSVAAMTRILQIIIFSLAMGATMFLVVVLTTPPPNPLSQSLVWLGVGFAALQIVLATIVPRIIAAQQRKAIVDREASVDGRATSESDAGACLQGLQVRRIIAGALLEGAAFFNLVAYMQGRHPYSLTAAIVLIVGIVLLIPLRSLVEQWLERELRTVRELRALEE
jgi:hypothetical protein